MRSETVIRHGAEGFAGMHKAGRLAAAPRAPFLGWWQRALPIPDVIPDPIPGS